MSVDLALPANVSCPLNELVLVDDDALTIEIVSWILKKGTHDSHLFTNTGEALSYLKLNTPRLLIVDFYMPEMTGLDFISDLYESTNLEHTKIYLCSAVRPPRDSVERFADMNVDMLDKQLICDRSKLTELLDRHLAES